MQQTDAGRYSGTGYLYQSLLGLYLILQSKSQSRIFIERFDDLEFAKDGEPLELIQVKHKIKSRGSLTNASPDLWNTVKNWIVSINTGIVDIKNSIFTIMTTETAKENSAAHFLRNSKERDPVKALEILEEISTKSISKDNQDAYNIFKNFSYDKKYQLMSNFYVNDKIPTINEIEDKIKDSLQWAVRRHHKDLLYERLLVWWLRNTIRRLSGISLEPISFEEIDAIIHDLADQFKSENLPIDFKDFQPSDEQILSAKQMIFVRQLEMILITEPRIKKAISDYYKAFNQRSRWVRDKLLFIDELKAYEDELIDEWDRLREEVTSKFSKKLSDEEMKQVGQSVFYTLDRSEHCIRKECTEPYVMRGSYHMLSDQKRIWWHPDFLNRLSIVLGGKPNFEN